jgi:large subunit ribosomal protein L15
MKLNELSDNPGAHKTFKRVGRGIGSGKGKTAGRGVKGQKARSGAVGIRQFEGGQMPLYMRLPKRGFRKPNRLKFVEISVGRIQAAIDAGALDGKAKIDGASLVAAGVLRRERDGVRLLGSGELKARLDIVVAHATAGAKAAVEKAGGSVAETIARVEKPAPEKRKEAKKAKPEAAEADDAPPKREKRAAKPEAAGSAGAAPKKEAQSKAKQGDGEN